MFKGAVKKAASLTKKYQQFAELKKCSFLDLNEFVQPSEIDGVHYDLDSHGIIAEHLFLKVKQLFNVD